MKRCSMPNMKLFEQFSKKQKRWSVVEWINLLPETLDQGE